MATALLFRVPFDVLGGEFSERLRSARLDLLGRAVLPVVRVAHRVASRLPRTREADTRIRANREPPQPAADAIADHERTMPAWRQTHAKAGQAAVPQIMAVRRCG